MTVLKLASNIRFIDLFVLFALKICISLSINMFLNFQFCIILGFANHPLMQFGVFVQWLLWLKILNVLFSRAHWVFLFFKFFYLFMFPGLGMGWCISIYCAWIVRVKFHVLQARKSFFFSLLFITLFKTIWRNSTYG